MKKGFVVMILFAIALLIAACSNEGGKNEVNMDQAEFSTEEQTTEESSHTDSVANDATTEENDGAQNENRTIQEAEDGQENRKIIYTANLRIEVKDFQKALDEIQTETSNHGGYIVESNMRGESESESMNGQITARIPQESFQEFVQFVEEGSGSVLESSVSGQDVTEEYVDLQSRLSSKEVVEERLLSFMKQAEETEDLLAISDDLATVQGEIEEITGRMNYLQNKTDLATVTIHVQENNVTISGMSEDDLNTWERTKQQFMKSINMLLSTFSGFFVFVIGNLPVILLLGLIGALALLIIRKRNRTGQKD
ncbi:DUF4349 domain-containing protein [Virgibacillus ainsalahensis]